MPTQHETGPLQGRPIIFGEVLFDRFPDGHALLGGAPFNVAWHLHGFGTNPLFISRVGDDAAGEEVRHAMARWGMDLSGLQCDAAHPTGSVEITLAAGQPTFDIRPHQAYDYIEAEASLAAVAQIPACLIYHGTLAIREAASRAALTALRAIDTLPVFVDVNLRPPWWDRTDVNAQLKGTRWAKLNADELAALEGNGASLEETVTAFHRRLGVEWLVVTRGEHGALLSGPQGLINGPPQPVATIADTVGAGDAFSAVTLLGILHNWPMEQTLNRALEFAAAVCGTQGALFHEADIYRDFLHAWEK